MLKLITRRFVENYRLDSIPIRHVITISNTSGRNSDTALRGVRVKFPYISKTRISRCVGKGNK